MQTNLNRLERDVGEWAQEQFGAEQPADYPLMGAGEEMGELGTSVLKHLQGIADSPKYADRDEIGPHGEKDAIGDIMIYLSDFAYRADLSLQRALDMQNEYLTKDIRDIDTSSDAMLALYGMYGLFCLCDYTMATEDNEFDAVHFLLGQLLVTLDQVAVIRGYDIDECIEMAASEVLEREWDSDITIE